MRFLANAQLLHRSNSLSSIRSDSSMQSDSSSSSNSLGELSLNEELMYYDARNLLSPTPSDYSTAAHILRGDLSRSPSRSSLSSFSSELSDNSHSSSSSSDSFGELSLNEELMYYDARNLSSPTPSDYSTAAHILRGDLSRSSSRSSLSSFSSELSDGSSNRSDSRSSVASGLSLRFLPYGSSCDSDSDGTVYSVHDNGLDSPGNQPFFGTIASHMEFLPTIFSSSSSCSIASSASDSESEIENELNFPPFRNDLSSTGYNRLARPLSPFRSISRSSVTSGLSLRFLPYGSSCDSDSDATAYSVDDNGPDSPGNQPFLETTASHMKISPTHFPSSSSRSIANSVSDSESEIENESRDGSVRGRRLRAKRRRPVDTESESESESGHRRTKRQRQVDTESESESRVGIVCVRRRAKRRRPVDTETDDDDETPSKRRFH